VLPFANLSGDSGQEYFSDAITDEMITALAALAPGHLAVIARTTAMHYKGSAKAVLRIGRELDVDYVVEGGVHHEQDRLTVNAQLIQVKDQMHIFARKYDVELRDIFKLMNRAASEIAESVGITPVTGDNEGSGVGGHERKEPTGDMAAYNEYILGRHFLDEATAEDFAKAKQHLESAIARDPEFAPAYDALAELNWYLGYLGYMPPRKAFSAGIMLALRAIEIDNTRAETHALLGQFHKICEYNWAEVHREMTLARQLDPESPLVRLRYAASWLMPQGRLEEAVAEVECALQLDPLSVMTWVWLGILRALTHHQHEEALAAGRRALELNPKSWGPYISIGTTYRDQGDFEQAIEAYRKGVEVSGDLPYMIGCLGLTLGLSGNAAEARSALKRLEACAAQGFVPPSSFAWLYVGLGEIDVAFEWLDRAVDECDQYMMPIKSYRFFDPIRKDPRFRALLRKMNLEP